MRPPVAAVPDLPVTRQTTLGAANPGDLSFYDIALYRAVTTDATDASSCSRTYSSSPLSAPMRRRNNLTSATLPASDAYASSYGGETAFIIEDGCGDTGDFTVDFDDHGMDSNQSDGTDWGEDDGTRKCATNNVGAAWQVWVREVFASCAAAQALGHTVDGTYSIDADGYGGAAAVDTLCDF